MIVFEINVPSAAELMCPVISCDKAAATGRKVRSC